MVGARRRSTVALVLLAVAWGSVISDPGPNQNAHMAHMTALAHGTPRIDRYHQWTRDTAYVGGHYYAAKAPGLAIVTLPWYFVLDATGLLVHGPPPSVHWPEAETLKMPEAAPWEFGLFGATLPFLALLLLVRWAIDVLVPGYGALTAITLGAGSIVGVLGTLFFDHELSALVGFTAFALLLRERLAAPDHRLLVAAGIAAGLAVMVEFPLALVALPLACYAAARGHAIRRALVFGGGLALGLIPLVAYNAWAYGSIKPLAYKDAVLEPGRSGHDVMGANSSGFYGVGLPRPAALSSLLLTPKGLLVMSPVSAVAAAGLVVLWRAGHRAEAALVAAVVTAFLLFNAAYYLPFGGFNDGPRFLVPMMPFLALGLAAAWRAWPGPALALSCASIVVTTVSILANPMIVSEDPGVMFHRLERGGDQTGAVSRTVLHWVWNSKIGPLLVVALVVLVAVTLVYAPMLPRLGRLDLLLGVAALIAWRIVYASGSILARAPHGWVAADVLLLALALAVVLLVRGALRAAAPALLILPLLWPRLAGHTGPSLVLVSVALLALLYAAVAQRRRGAAPTSR